MILKNVILIVGLGANLSALSFQQACLVTHVKKSIEDAKHEKSKITQDIIELSGLSSTKLRHLLNNICSLPKANYVEIGAGVGSTFVSALYKNTLLESGVAIDNSLGFSDLRTQSFNNVAKFLPLKLITIYELDAFKINKKEVFKNPINIYFYNDHASFESVKRTFTYYDDAFADTFIVITDNYNEDAVVLGIQEAFYKLRYEMLFEEVLLDGVYVAIVTKKQLDKRWQPAAIDPMVGRSLLTPYYDYYRQYSIIINEHLPTLRKLSAECSSVTEVGVSLMVATWALFLGLSESDAQSRSYLGIDIELPPRENFQVAQRLARESGILFDFWCMDDMKIKDQDMPCTDLLFIDSLHTYCHLTYELETFSKNAKKYIVMHDTSAPWGNANDTEYLGNYREYPAHIDRNKKGLWPAVEDFLNKHKEWKLEIRYFNNHGLTILKRVKI